MLATLVRRKNKLIMSAYRLVDDIKGTTSLRLFLFLSLGIIISQYLPPFESIVSVIVIGGIFTLSVVLYLCRQYRVSKIFFYLLLTAYGLCMAPYSLIPAELSVVNSQLSIVKDTLISLYTERGISAVNLPLLSALTLGERSTLAETMVNDFRASGVAHVLVVSGMHVGFLYLLISFLIRRLPYKRATALIGIFVMWGYAGLVGFTVSVCRAVFMFTVLLIMKVVGESYRSFHALFMAGFIQLLVTPSALFDIGFQLSYAAVLSILIFYPLLALPFSHSQGHSYSHSQSHRLLLLFYNPIRLTISAQILIAPLVAYYFGQFPLYFVLTNLAITLLVPIIFIGGFMVLIPYFGVLVAYPINHLLSFLQKIVSAIASLPMALVQVRITLLTLLLVYVLIALVVCYALLSESGEK